MGFLFKKSSNSTSDNEPRINSLKYEQSTYGATKSVLYGTNRLCGNVIDNVDFVATAHKNTTRMGKGGGQTMTEITYTYTSRVVIALCEGIAKSIRKVLVDKGTYSLSDLNLNFLSGSSSQSCWGEMLTKHPDHALHYRNLAYVAGNINLTSNAGIPQFNFEVNGKFTDNTDDITPVIEEGFHFSTDSGTLNSCEGTLDYSEYYLGVESVKIVYYDSASREYTNANFTRYSVAASGGKVKFTFNLSGLGAVSAHLYVTYNSTVRLDANPKDIVFDILTNTNYGAGLDSSLIDNESISNFSDFCIASNIFLSPLYDSQTETQEVLSKIAEICNSVFIWSQGKLKIVPLGDETVTNNGVTFTPNVTPIYDLNEDDFLCDNGEEPITCSRTSQSDVKNSVKIEYVNRANNYNTEIAEAQDIANITLYGLNPADVITARQICTSEVAQKAAETALARNIAVRNTYSFKLSYKYILLDCMDIVTLTHSRLGLNRQLVKITSIQENDGILEIEAEEMIIGTATPAKYTSQNASFESVDTATSVGNINDPIIFEPPFELTQNELQIWIGISSPQNLFGGGEIWISEDGETYKEIGILKQSVRQGVLTSELPSMNAVYDNVNALNVDVSMSCSELLSGSEADMENLNTLCWVDGEFISYKDAELVEDYQYSLTTLQRGAYYSTSKAHASGSQFCRVDNECFFKVPFTESDIGKRIYVKICSFNTFGAGLQDLATVQTYAYTIEGKAKEIYPDNVTNFNVIQKGSEYVFSWNYTANNDTYEIREGATWDDGVIIGKNIPLNSFASDIIMTGEKHFWIKANNGMNYSDVATEDVIYIDSIPDSNVVVAYDLLADLENGTFKNTKQYKNTVKLTTSVKWQKIAQCWGAGSNSEKYYQNGGIWGAEADHEGYYTSAVQDLGGVLESGVRGTISVNSENETLTAEIQWRHSAEIGEGDVIDGGSASSDKYIFGGSSSTEYTDIIDGGTSSTEYTDIINGGTSEGAGNRIVGGSSSTEYTDIIDGGKSPAYGWSNWETLTSDGVIATFRYYQCRLHLVSEGGGQLICTTANIIIDVPDKLLTMTAAVTNAANGVQVEYDFYATPAIVATVNENINAYAVVTEKDESHAVIKIYDNNGTAVTGTVDLMIKGY